MLIPSVFYGLYPEVKKAVRLPVKRIIAGVAINTAVPADADLERYEGVGLYLDQPAPHYEEQPHLHLRTLPDALLDAMATGKTSWDRHEAWLGELLGLDWAVLALMGRSNAQDWLRNPDQMKRFCERAESLMPQFLVLGARFLDRGNTRETLVKYGDGFTYAAGNIGYTVEAARALLEGKTRALVVV
jgi:hypothetical protein